MPNKRGAMPDTLKLERLPDYGDLMTIEEFAANIKSGLFMNQDGTGYFATVSGMSRKHAVDCSDFTVPEGFGFTHVEWFNK